MTSPDRDEPGSLPSHALELEVGEGDVDALGHTNNVAYVRWIQDVAVAHSDAVGLPLERYLALGGVFVVRRHEVDYLRPTLRGERLEVRTWVPTAMAAKVVRRTVVRRVGGAVVARADTTWGFVDTRTQRPARIPEAVRAAFGMPKRAPA